MSFSFFNSFNGNSQRLGQNYATQSYDVAEPTGINFISSDASSITFSFTAPKTSGTINGYKFSVNGQVMNATGGPGAYTINGLSPGQQYSINAVADVTTSSTSSTTTTTTAISPTPTVQFDSNINITTTGSNLVSDWKDVTNTYSATQLNSSLRPTLNTSYINGKSGIVFNGTSGMMLKANGLPSSINTATFFFVMQFSSYSGANQFLSTDGAWVPGSIHVFAANGSLQPCLYNSQAPVGLTIPLNTPFILMINYSTIGPSTTYARYNGVSSSVYNFGSSSGPLLTSNIDIGGWSEDGGRTIRGGISEILYYNQSLTATQISQAEGYLAWKWGLQTSLPVAHPNYSTNGYTTSTTVTTTTTKNIVSNPSRLLTSTTLAPFPTNIQLISATTTSLTFSFSAPSQGGTPTSYVPYINGSSTTGSGGPSSYTISGLTAGTNYSVALGANVTTTNTFSPTSISGTLLWLDGADSTTITYSSGSNISQWSDKSGTGNNFTQSTAGSQPVYAAMSNGMNAINFASSRNMVNTSIVFPTTYSIFAIGYTSATGYARLLNGGIDYNLFFGIGNGNTQFITLAGNGQVQYWNDVNTNSPATSVASLCLMEMTNNNTSTGLIPYVNGTALNAKNGSTLTFTGLQLGNFFNGAYWNGFIAEVLIYNSVLSTTDRQKVEGYLAWKWNIKANLPGAHPYYSAGPSTTTTTLYQNPSPVSLYTLFNYPTNIQLLSSTVNSLTVSFTAPGSNPTSYTPYINSVAGTGSGTPSSYTITGLSAGTSYSVALGANVTTTGSFNPLSITGSILWLDAADGTTITYSSGSNISQWSDKSTIGNHFTQTTVASQPLYGTMTNGKNAINLVSNSSFMSNTSISFPTVYSVFAVGYTTGGHYQGGGPVFARLLNSNNTTFYFGAGIEGTNFSTFVGNTTVGNWIDTNTDTPATAITSLCLMEVTNNNSSTGLLPYVNGKALDAKNGTTNTFTGLTMGSMNGGGGQTWWGYVSEILIYNSVLSTTDRQKVEGYLANKWLIQSSLPVAHPYYSAAPTSTVSVIYQNPTAVSLSTTSITSAIPAGISGGAPTIYYPFWADTKDYASGSGVTNATFSGTTPPSISSTTTYKSYAAKSLYNSNTSCSMKIPNITINTAVGFTICLWFNLTTSSDGMLWYATPDGGYPRTFIYYTGSKIRVAVETSVNSGSNDIFSINLNTWYFLTFVQPPGGQPYASLNNASVTNCTLYNAVNYTTTSNTIFSFNSSGAGVPGYMNNFYFFNRALSANEITALYNQ